MEEEGQDSDEEVGLEVLEEFGWGFHYFWCRWNFECGGGVVIEEGCFFVLGLVCFRLNSFQVWWKFFRNFGMRNSSMNYSQWLFLF